MKLKLTAALTFALATSFAHSQPVNPMLSKLSSLGGAVEATAKNCDFEIDAKSAREQQKEQFISMGGTSEDFETSYQSGFDDANAKYLAASAAEQKTMCKNFEALTQTQAN